VIEPKASTEDGLKIIDKRWYMVVEIRAPLSAGFFKLMKPYILDLPD
jgi:hypothetical protein